MQRIIRQIAENVICFFSGRMEVTMDREKRFCELDTEIEKWSDDERHFVLWQLLKDYANKLDIPENANTLEEHKLMTFNHNLWVDCSELIDILNYELWR